MTHKPLDRRMAAVGITSCTNYVVMFPPFLGIMTGLIQPLSVAAVMAVAWGVIILFNLVALPVEFDASRRAKTLLADFDTIAPGDETLALRKVFEAAAWTCEAAFITSLIYLLCKLLLLLRRH
jgi:Zn-dependent membrane protease YugP